MLKKIRIESSTHGLSVVENEIDYITSEAGISKENYGKILVSVLEAVNNAIVHGNKNDSKKFVDIELELLKDVLKITVTDQGKGFRPSEVPDPTKQENIEILNGRGVFLMSKLADEIKFNRKGNSVKMTFKKIMS
jgi:serine/threonine-protein kinase RsbW